MKNNPPKNCILEASKPCDECGQCQQCDLDAAKPCTNCCRCLEEADYNGIEITEIIIPDKITVKRKKRSN